MGYVYKLSPDNGTTNYTIASGLYGTCSTAASTAQKDVTLADFDTLRTGVTVHVKFTYSNTAANATLKVGSTSAKNLCMYGTTRVGTTVDSSWPAGAVVSFTYDGTSWVMNDYADVHSQLVPSGGSAGQVLAKASAADYDTEWVNQSGGGGDSDYVVTTATIPTTGWSSNSITVSVSGITSSNDVIVGPSPSSAAGWTDAGILCTAQGSGTLTFTRQHANATALTANVLIMEGALDNANGVAF